MKKTFQVLNQMVVDGAIENYAVAGAIGAIFYVEPSLTQDIDVLVVTPDARYRLVIELPGWEYLKAHGYNEIRKEGIVVEGWPVQFMPVSNPLEEDAYRTAQTLDYEGIPVRVVLAEYLLAIMLNVGRLKDFLCDGNATARAKGFGGDFQSRRGLAAFVFVDVNHAQHFLNDRRVETFRN